MALLCSMFPRSTHETFAEKLYQTFKDHKRFSKPKLAKTDFTVCHYAGDVTYQSEFFLDKNKDYVVAEHQALLNASKCSFVSNLFPPVTEESKSSKFSSIGSKFKQQLQSLLETLSHTEPHYVRCVKPNSLLKPDIFENHNILQQLRCGGVMEAIRISCAGFPTRKPFSEFVDRFKILAPDAVEKSDDDIKSSVMLLEKANLKGYQIGKTKVFLRAGQMAELDACRAEILGKSATKIQAKYLSHTANKKYLSLRASSIPIQTIVRGQVARSWYQRRRREMACLTIQKCTRMFLVMKGYRALYCSVIRLQASIRGMAASNMHLHKQEDDAAIIVQTQCRHDLARISFLRNREAAIVTQSVCRRNLAHKELTKLRMARMATLKLEEQIKDLTNQLEQEKQARADMEEEISKLRSFLKEITEYSVKEEAAADVEIGKLPQPEDIPKTGNETIDKLTAENIKLKYAVSSLQLKFDEAQKLCEERSNQARDAEAMVIELKTSMQSLQEKLCDIETEEQILRQQVMSHQSGAMISQSPTKENVEALLAAVRHELGFSKGKPVATYIIYKSLLHWKYFEAERTSVFDRLIQVISSAIERDSDNKHMAYWLSTTSTLLFLIQKSLSPAGHKSPRPSLFGRMTQGFNKSNDLVRHVEGKYPALLFKQQLTAYVEKIFAIIRNNLKNNLSSLISYCFQEWIWIHSLSRPILVINSQLQTKHLNALISFLMKSSPNNRQNKALINIIPTVQAVRTSKDNPPPPSHWGIVIECLNGTLTILKENHCCTFRSGEYVKAGLDELEQWCGQTKNEVTQQKTKIGYDELTTKLCPVLGVQQHYRLCTLYTYDPNTGTVTPEVRN
ncbi:putative myosin ATPase [Helianthus annuus]|nr:putative myosin ATPase [Helianthus annuus]